MNNTILDDHWFSILDNLKVPRPHELFDEDLEFGREQRESFLEGEIEWPVINAPEALFCDTETYLSSLRKLANRVDQEERNPIVREIYQAKINELSIGICLIEARQAEDWESWQHLNTKLYGVFDEDLFWEVYRYFHDQAVSKLESPSSSLKQKDAAERLLHYLCLNEEQTLPKLAKNLIRKEKNILQSEISMLNSVVPKQATFAASETKRVLEQWLEKIGISGWNVVVDNTSSKTMMRVLRTQKLISLPVNRILKRQRLLELLVHEIGVSLKYPGHIGRSFNGASSRLKLLSLGLPYYVSGEEGLCTFWEEVLSPTNYPEHKMWLYLIIGLALGIDGEYFTFRDIYDVSRTYFGFQHPGSDDSKKLRAYRAAMRIFRGTDTSMEGIVFIKDKIYLEGNIRIWNMMKYSSERLEICHLGSFDPTSDQHIRWLKNLALF